MCGEIDDQAALGQDLLEQIRVMTKMLGVPAAGGEGSGPKGLAAASGRAAYMDRVFQDGLARAVTDMSRAEPDEAVDALAAQAIALARLAGFLAGQLPPEADLFRATVEALTTGHSEPGGLARAHQAEQDRLHGHSHDHDDEHDHDHHHDDDSHGHQHHGRHHHHH